MATKDPTELFVKIGLAEAKAKETTKNAALTSTLLTIIEEVGVVYHMCLNVSFNNIAKNVQMMMSNALCCC